MSLENPRLVVLVSEFNKHKMGLFSVCERPEPRKVLLEDSNEPLGTPVSLRFVDKSRRRPNAEECNLLLKKIRNKLGTVIMAKRETLSDPFINSSFTPH